MLYAALKRRSSTVLRAAVHSRLIGSGLALDLGPPPADANEEEAPVGKKFWRLAFKGVADELENPSQDEQSQRVGPETMEEEAGEKNYEREHNGWDAQSVAGAVHGMLVTGSVLRDPLLAGAVAQHGGRIIHRRGLLCTRWRGLRQPLPAW